MNTSRIAIVFELFIIITCSFFVISCKASFDKSYPAYGYKHHVGVTGINSALVVDSIEVLVQFSTESDQRALEALRNLDWNIIYGNADGKRMKLYGILDDEVKNKPAIPGSGSIEEYREFTLKYWSIETPLEFHMQDPNNYLQVDISMKNSLKDVGYDIFYYLSALTKLFYK